MSDFLNNDFEKMDNLIDLTRGNLKLYILIFQLPKSFYKKNFKELANYHMESSKILQETINQLNEKYIYNYSNYIIKLSHLTNC
jgi:hypothetical protein